MSKKSSFQFKGYKINKSLIEIKGIGADELTVNFEPSGVLDRVKNIFFLNLKVKVFDLEKNTNIEVEIEGQYSFNDEDNNLKDFLFLNAPAILFPYIRSYITALSALSGAAPITLPTMNLSGLSEQLKDNITEK